MKIHIFLDIQDGPWGGGNQFLKALRVIWREEDCYAEDLNDADCVLVNSHHFDSQDNLERLLTALKNNPDMSVVHRIDGPVTFIRKSNDGTDDLIFKFNELFADASILQSKWSVDKTKELGYDIKVPVKVIYNAPDPTVFYPAESKKKNVKTKLIATSWSSNIRKGFDVYQWMDENLDWDKYEMSFIGNTDVFFKNVSHIPPMDSTTLSEALRESDIFITASKADPCSNSLIEALHCGLPALALKDGGHPELIGKAGEAFGSAEEIPTLLEKISDNQKNYVCKIKLSDIKEVAKQYYQFIKTAKGNHYTAQKHNEFMGMYVTHMRRHNPGLAARVFRKIKSKIFASG